MLLESSSLEPLSFLQVTQVLGLLVTPVVLKVNLKFQNPGHFIVTNGLASPADGLMLAGYLKLSHGSCEDRKAPSFHFSSEGCSLSPRATSGLGSSAV